FAALVAEAEADFQRRNLRHGALVGGVFTPGVGQAGVGLPVVGQLVAAAEFGAGDAGVDVVYPGNGVQRVRSRTVREQDVVPHFAGIGGNPGFDRATAILQTHVQLGGLLRLHRLVGGRLANLVGGGEQLPTVRE